MRAEMPPDRLPPIARAHWTAAQAECAEEIIRGPRGALIAPFVPLLRSPELMRHAQRMGEYLRYRSALGLRCSEFAILLVARAWHQPVEWAIHAPIALREGVAPSTVAALAEGRPPPALPTDEAVVYAVWQALEARRQVDTPTWRRAVDCFGEQGTVDLLGLLGYYGLLALVMNAACTPAPASTAPPLQPLAGRQGGLASD